VFCDLIYFLSIYPKVLAMLFMLSSILDLCMLIYVIIKIYFIRNLILQLPIFLPIQKSYYTQSVVSEEISSRVAECTRLILV
jgi:hypothetical protein